MPRTSLEKIASKLGYASLDKVLYHFPRRYEDRSHWASLKNSSVGDEVTLLGKLVSTRLQRWRRGMCCFEAVFLPEGEAQTLRLIWYGLPYLGKTLTVERAIVIHGKLDEDAKGLRMHHPEYELVTDEEPLIHMGRIVPIYPLTQGVTQKAVRAAFYNHTTKNDFQISESFPVPPSYLNHTDAMRGIHFPDSLENLSQARRRMVYEELFQMQMILSLRRARIKNLPKKREKNVENLLAMFYHSLPFELTEAQKKVCQEIDSDLQKSSPMNRLLQGDVGSGKTVVAAHALLRAIERNENGALLAPTEILAEQHAINFRRWMEPLGIEIVLSTRSNRAKWEEGLFQSKGVIFIGTHALIQEGVQIPKLGMVVIDEQHKFGVVQRLALQQKGLFPDVLAMSATPIPRTLCLSFYGDLDVSTLDEIPPGRGPLKTVLRTEKELPKIWNFFKQEIALGHQAYVIYPLVNESDKSTLKSAQKATEDLKTLFGESVVSLLHGRMSGEEKETVMCRFRNKEFSILVATIVVEVGVDVPNATVMLIEHADRFGLAQLHQLRGRVGRGTQRSFCILIGSEKNKEGWERLRIMENTADGFRLAEEDLRLRGPGDILGTDQSGLPSLRLANLITDRDIFNEAKTNAIALLEKDPQLTAWPALKNQLIRYFEDQHSLSIN